ncbi:hypothetical protein [Companilactobacillus bobalius]|uniref:Uncharacterized protein n=2 Tax=Companilactobacillus bobalius TaxID=2801451 RepID=A0A202F5U4_9LACO|nr:hypothetical protein [Companilactobacillus bobalius]KAE9560716.1 hypothetical protein ATN92_11320 [Companilactobacillus bobalius]KRK85060.1 hypothetical protein FC78_GL000865 [Companilactobacillus bobalius DSM 19674]OVE95854.1 hypothetical protein LKACC16343_02607 [Companilactobacillus bobalius]GEO59292.1 hypothetical protein LBO01_24210 [Companilactobacillus paralimentarius]
MTILFDKKLTLNEDSTTFIENYINYVRTINPEDLYEGKKDKNILKNKFIFRIHQLANLDSAIVSLNILDKKINVLARIPGFETVVIGSYPLNSHLKKIMSQEVYPTIKITGGRYKKVVPTDFDKDIIKNGFEPYGIILQLHQVENVVYKSRKIDVIYKYVFKSERSLVNVSKILMLCFALFGLALGLGFMFLGFFMTGLMVIVAFFGVNSYTLILSDTYKPKQELNQTQTN